MTTYPYDPKLLVFFANPLFVLVPQYVGNGSGITPPTGQVLEPVLRRRRSQLQVSFQATVSVSVIYREFWVSGKKLRKCFCEICEKRCAVGCVKFCTNNLIQTKLGCGLNLQSSTRGPMEQIRSTILTVQAVKDQPWFNRLSPFMYAARNSHRRCLKHSNG